VSVFVAGTGVFQQINLPFSWLTGRSSISHTVCYRSTPMVNAPQDFPDSVNAASAEDGHGPSTLVTSHTLLEALRDQHLLEMAQLNELFLADTRGSFAAGADVARELLQRGWITAYQANRLLQGRGSELALGPYVLLDRLGEGGAGQVFKARHRAMGRVVALKVIRKELLGDADMLSRFQREVRVISQLTHPNIIQAYDAGSVASTYYLAMEFGEGIDLHRMLKQRGVLPVPQACDYIRQTALALQYIHHCGLVHRDIKPSNLLITGLAGNEVVDASGRPAGGVVKLLDLGLARPLTTNSTTPTSMVTEANTALGTPDFMAPEQALNFHDADIRADIYALGCTLFATLAGRPPFPGNNLAEKLLRHQQVPPPDLKQLRPDVPPELAAMVDRMLAKQPGERFQTPEEVAQLLAPLARGEGPLPVPVRGDGALWATVVDEPISTDHRLTPVGVAARTELIPPPPAAVARPRRSIWIGLGVAGLLAVLVLIAGVLLLPGRKPAPVEQGKPAPSSRTTVTVAANRAWQDTGVDVEVGKGVSIVVNGKWRKGKLECSAAGLKTAPRERALVPEAPALCLLARIGDEEPTPLKDFTTLRPTKNGRLFVRINDLDLQQNEGSLSLIINGGRQSDETVSPPSPMRIEAAEEQLQALLARLADPKADRRQLTDDVQAFALKFADLPQASAAAALRLKLPSPLDAMKHDQIPPEELRAAGLDAKDAPAELVAVFGDHRFGYWRPIIAMVYSPDGQRLACAYDTGMVKLWERATGKECFSAPHGGGVLTILYTTDGQLISVGHEGTAKVWDATGKVLKSHELGRQLTSVAEHGGKLVCGYANGKMAIRKLTEGKEERVLIAEGGMVRTIAFQPGGKMFASVNGDDGNVYLWETKTWTEVRPLRGHTSFVQMVAFSGDGKTLASKSKDGTMRVWEVDTGREQRKLDGVAIDPYVSAMVGRGQVLAGPGANWQHLYLWDLGTGKLLHELGGNLRNVTAVAANPNGREFAYANLEGVLRFYNVETGARLDWPAGVTLMASRAVFRADGRAVAGCFGDGTVRLWDTTTRKPLRTLSGYHHPTLSVAFSPDGKVVAAGNLNGTVKLWNADSGAEQATLGEAFSISVDYATAPDVAFSPDGGMLATGTEHRTLIKFWVAASVQELRSVPGSLEATAVVFSPDGRTVACTNRDVTTDIFDVATGGRLHTLGGHNGQVNAAAFSPDGRLVASVGDDRSLKLWEPTGRLLHSWSSHEGPVVSVAFRPDSQQLATAAHDGTVRLWDPNKGSTRIIRVGPGPGRINSVAYSADGRHLVTANGDGTIYILRVAE
jgi:WD40 repeat protein/serine/threonine protein kinase